MPPFKACSEALRLRSAAEMARSEGDEVVLIRPMPAGRVRPEEEVTERSGRLELGVVLLLLLWSDI